MLFRKAYQVGSIPGIGAAVIHRVEATVCIVLKAECVFELFPTDQFPELQLLLDQFWYTDARMVKVVVPPRQIFDRGHKTGGSYRIEIGPAQAVVIIPVDMAVGDMLHNLGVVIAEVRILHIERNKNMPGRKLAPRLVTTRFTICAGRV
jgi:hypothetical protein